MIAVARAGASGLMVAWVFGCASIVAAQQPAVADPPMAARLHYSVEHGAERCPDEATLKQAVHRQLGYPVFERTPATHVVTAVVRRIGGRFKAQITLGLDGGDAVGSRDIESRSVTCDELAAALSLAIAMALHPTPMLHAPVDAPESVIDTRADDQGALCPEPAPCPAPAACPVCPAPPSDSTTVWHAGLGMALGVGALPSVAPALAVAFGLRFGATALSLEGVVYPERTTAREETSFETAAQVARLSVCRWVLTGDAVELSACGVGGVGVLRTRSAMALDRSLVLVATAGVRAHLQLHVAGPAWFELRTDLHANLAGHTFALGERQLWAMPALFAEFALVGVVRFL